MFYVPLAAVEEEGQQQGRDGGEDDRPRDESGATATGGAEQPPVALRVANESNLADSVVKGVVCLSLQRFTFSFLLLHMSSLLR